MPSIEDITTLKDLSKSSLESYRVISNKDPLDRLEFSIGVERGEILKYSDSPLLKIKVRKDMIELLQQHKWALMPSDTILERINELFLLNHENVPRHRLKFTDIIPVKAEYEYRFFCLDVKETPPFYIQGKRYAYPFTDLPSVWSSLHPCFAIPYALNYYEQNFDIMSARKTMDTTESLCDDISFALSRPLFLSWVMTASTNVQGRPVPLARHDPPDTNPIVRPKLLEAKKAKKMKAKKAGNAASGPANVKPMPLARHDSPKTLKVKKATTAKAKKAGKATSGPAREIVELVVQRKRKLSNSTATSTEDDAPSAKRRST